MNKTEIKPDRKLTNRELEVLALIRLAHNNGAIAKQLRISKRTLSCHISNIIRKVAPPRNMSFRAWLAVTTPEQLNDWLSKDN